METTNLWEQALGTDERVRSWVFAKFPRARGGIGKVSENVKQGCDWSRQLE